MEYTILIIGILIFALLYSIFNMPNTDANKIIKVALGLAVIILIMILAKTAIDNKTRCYPVVNQTVDLNISHSYYTYTTFCYTETTNTPNTLNKYINIGIRIILLGTLVFGLWFGWIYLKKKAGL